MTKLKEHIALSLFLVLLITTVKSLGILGYELNQKPSNFINNLIDIKSYLPYIIIMNIVYGFMGKGNE